LRRFVVDCSISAAWLFEEDWGGVPQAVLGELKAAEAVVPALWPYELANALVIAERRSRVSTAKTDRFLEELRDLRITIDARPAQKVLAQLLPLARRHGLTAYDAAYLELAIHQGIELATLDDDLRRAAAGAGVALFEPSSG
jgi:predicted nucleic acid-binding protein